ncbi:hypothetical protein D3C76_1375320 [compost metagenome]
MTISDGLFRFLRKKVERNCTSCVACSLSRRITAFRVFSALNRKCGLTWACRSLISDWVSSAFCRSYCPARICAESSWAIPSPRVRLMELNRRFFASYSLMVPITR